MESRKTGPIAFTRGKTSMREAGASVKFVREGPNTVYT